MKLSVPLRAVVRATELVQESAASRLVVRVQHVPLMSTQWLRLRREDDAKDHISLVVAEVAVQEPESPAFANILARELPIGTRIQFRPLKKTPLREETVLQAIVKQKPVKLLRITVPVTVCGLS